MEYLLALLWLAAYLALLLLGAPIVARLVPGFEDRGAAIALPFSLVLLTLSVYWIGHVSFGRTAVLLGLFVLGVLAVAATRGGAEIRLRPVGEIAGVFAVAFCFLVAIRAIDPAVNPQTGEMFMDFGLLQSLLRAPRLPPEDMWFAGEPVRYYYGGYLIAATMAHVTGTAGRFAYNLALAGFYATLVSTAYGLAGVVANGHGASRRTAGAFAAFLVGFASNLYTPVRLALDRLPDDLAATIGARFGAEADIAAVDEFFYNNAGWVIPGAPTEFPLLSYVNGNMRAQMTDTAFLLLVAALCYAYYRAPESAVGRRRRALAATVPVLGLISLTNTWSLPTGCGLALLTLHFAPAHPLTLLPASVTDRWGDSAATDGGSAARGTGLRLVGATAVAAALGVLGALTVLPFFLGAVSGRELAVLPARTGMGLLVLVHGGFLLVFAPYLFGRLRPTAVPDRLGAALVAAWLALAVCWIADLAALALVGPFLLAAWVLLRRRRRLPFGTPADRETRRRADAGFEAVLIAAGAGLVLLIEFVYLNDGAAQGRFNTMVKVSTQVWLLWSVAAGVVLARYREGMRAAASASASSLRRWGTPALTALLVLSLSLYGVSALGNHVRADYPYGGPPHRLDDPTLDATAFVASEHPDEAEAIAWLGAHEGRPHIVTEPGFDIYSWVSAPSSLTGIPTVLGWEHEVDYHGHEAYDRRVADVRAIYNGSAADRARLLRTYDVRYVYVGPGERERYAVTDYSAEAGITVAFENEAVTIYAVDRSALG